MRNYNLVPIYTDKSYNRQLTTYTRCLAATRLPGHVTFRHMGFLQETGQRGSKLDRLGLVCRFQKRAAASMKNITKNIISIQRTGKLLL